MSRVFIFVGWAVMSALWVSLGGGSVRQEVSSLISAGAVLLTHWFCNRGVK